jgi:lipopolysaccharide biosynthesis regulator YciM
MLAAAAELLRPLAPGDRTAAEALREVLADQGAWREAAALQARLAGGPSRLEAHLLAAAARADLAGWVAGVSPPEAAARALATARLAVEADPTCGAALLALSEAEGAGGTGPGALQALGRALEVAPGAAVLAWPAVVRQPDREAALALLLDRQVEAPGDAALRMLSGRLLHRLGRRPEALAALRSALELDQSGEVTLALRDLLREVEPPAAEGEDLQARHALVVLALQRRARAARCTRCGAEAATRAWRCRACGAFDSLAC